MLYCRYIIRDIIINKLRLILYIYIYIYSDTITAILVTLP